MQKQYKYTQYTQEELLRKAVNTLDKYVGSRGFRKLVRYCDEVANASYLHGSEKIEELTKYFGRKPDESKYGTKSWCIKYFLGNVDFGYYSHGFEVFVDINGGQLVSVRCQFNATKHYRSAYAQKSLTTDVDLQQWAWGMQSRKNKKDEEIANIDYYRRESVQRVASAISGVLTTTDALVEKVVSQ